MTTAGELRTALRRMAGTVFLVATGREGSRCGLTATSVTALSLDPPALLVCINRGSSTCAALTRNGRFSVNLLPAGQCAAARTFSSPALTGELRFGRTQWTEWMQSVPLFREASASIVCELDQAIPFGSHLAVLGRVIHVHLGTRTAPLVYFDGDYRHLSPGGREEGFTREVAPDVLGQQ